ncbi:hypothetical protein ACOMHN_065298 [Nucella lapillus]
MAACLIVWAWALALVGSFAAAGAGPQLQCQGPVRALVGSEVNLTVTFDLGGDRQPTYSHVWTMKRSDHKSNGYLATCLWKTAKDLEKDHVCGEKISVSRTSSGNRFHLNVTISNVTKEKHGNYTVTWISSTHDGDSNRSCDIQLIVEEEARAGRQLQCQGPVRALVGSEVNLTVTFDLGGDRRPIDNHVLTMKRSDYKSNGYLATCLWKTAEDLEKDHVCEEKTSVSRTSSGNRFQLNVTISNVTKEKHGNYTVTWRISTHDGDSNRSCDTQLIVEEAQGSDKKVGHSADRAETSEMPATTAVLIAFLVLIVFGIACLIYHRKKILDKFRNFFQGNPNEQDVPDENSEMIQRALQIE